tara:strand:+ start:6298 stop:7116 length:819 start_codon:yes stop_codon:yes gene_type:complete
MRALCFAMKQQINTEQEFDRCVKEIGGNKVSDSLSGSPNFDNADYIFEKYNVIAELKCLTEDKSEDDVIKIKTDDIFSRYFKESGFVVFGTTWISSDQLSPNCTKEISELYRKPIKGAMKKANKQIRETKENLNKESAHGLLILVNDKNKAVDPSRINWILAETFKRDSLSSINSVLFITLNMLATHPAINNDMLVWVEGYRDPNFICPQGLFDELRVSVNKHWENLIGQEIRLIKLKITILSMKLSTKKHNNKVRRKTKSAASLCFYFPVT